MLKVAAITGGVNVPSARFRIRQLIPALRVAEVNLTEYIPSVSTHPPRATWIRPFWGVAALAARIPAVAASHSYDAVILQREMISTLLSLERFTGRPRILDVDDAIFLNMRGKGGERLAAMCDAVICGNDYLAEFYSRYNPNVRVIPTAVDTDRFTPRSVTIEGHKPVIGWIGSSSNFDCLNDIEEALDAVFRKIPDARLQIVADKRPHLQGITARHLDFVPWSPDGEVSAIQRMSVGIMPLRDSPWVRGKCSFKMLQYMACGLPVVVSPVGMNRQVLDRGEIGIGPLSNGEWADALVWLLSDPAARQRMGKEGYRTVENHYSVQVIAPRLAKAIREFAA